MFCVPVSVMPLTSYVTLTILLHFILGGFTTLVCKLRCDRGYGGISWVFRIYSAITSNEHMEVTSNLQSEWFLNDD